MHKNHIHIERLEELNDDVEDILWTRVKAKPSFSPAVIYRPDCSDMIKCDAAESILEASLEKAAMKIK